MPAEVSAMAQERIESRPDVMFGKPVIKGTRIPVEQVLRELAAGATFEELLEAHPRLGEDDVRAALAYAADELAGEEILHSKKGAR